MVNNGLTVCPLCNGIASFLAHARERDYYRCGSCKSAFLHPLFYLSTNDERARYLLHRNDPNDLGYRTFLAPIVNAVAAVHHPMERGLDYGSGLVPAVTNLLREKGFENVTPYDPFFFPNAVALEGLYDFIACSETAEHFHQPVLEFKRMRNLLKPGGTLALLTLLFNDTIDFGAWHYKNDPTHVFFYSPEAFDWIRRNVGFAGLRIQDRLIILKL